MNPAPTPSRPAHLLARAAQYTARTLITLFVLWHLSFLIITNAALTPPQTPAPDSPAPALTSLPARTAAAWIHAAKTYESYGYLDQSWGMFASPVWRHCPFPAGRLTLSDGSTLDLLSSNEPPDKSAFCRVGGARLRKLEHYLVSHDLRSTYQEPMQRRYAQTYADRWRNENPTDPRRVTAVTLLSRDFTAPNPGERWQSTPPATITTVARYEMQ